MDEAARRLALQPQVAPMHVPRGGGGKLQVEGEEDGQAAANLPGTLSDAAFLKDSWSIVELRRVMSFSTS